MDTQVAVTDVDMAGSSDDHSSDGDSRSDLSSDEAEEAAHAPRDADAVADLVAPTAGEGHRPFFNAVTTSSLTTEALARNAKDPTKISALQMGQASMDELLRRLFLVRSSDRDPVVIVYRDCILQAIGRYRNKYSPVGLFDIGVLHPEAVDGAIAAMGTLAPLQRDKTRSRGRRVCGVGSHVYRCGSSDCDGKCTFRAVFTDIVVPKTTSVPQGTVDIRGQPWRWCKASFFAQRPIFQSLLATLNPAAIDACTTENGEFMRATVLIVTGSHNRKCFEVDSAIHKGPAQAPSSLPPRR